jgi:NADH:ubiquinone oxidoreductase subunit C
VETKWVKAEAWPDLVRSLTAEGWWLADLCGVDRLHLAGGGHGEAEGAGVAGEEATERLTIDDAKNDGAAQNESRFEVVAQFLHRDKRERATVHVLAQGDPPAIPSITAMWPSADFMEREAFDLMGIVFDGHPNLTRIMLPEGWEGHPLRKDYGVGKVPIEFIPQPFLQFDSPHQQPNSPEAGVTVDRLGQPEVDAGQAAGGLSHFGDTKITSQRTEDEGS